MTETNRNKKLNMNFLRPPDRRRSHLCMQPSTWRFLQNILSNLY